MNGVLRALSSSRSPLNLLTLKFNSQIHHSFLDMSHSLGPYAISTRDATTLEAQDYAMQYRTLLSIVWSCITTILLCIWVTMHPNMPEPVNTKKLGWLKALKIHIPRFIRSSLVHFLTALLAPEWIFSMSLQQSSAAEELATSQGAQPASVSHLN